MKISKKPLLEIDPYPDEFEYEDFVIALGELVKQRFKSGYVKCSAHNMGWRNLSGYKVFELDTNDDFISVAKEFLSAFTPNCEWSARVYSLNSGKGLYFNVKHHDNPVNGDEYYLLPISERTYERLS